MKLLLAVTAFFAALDLSHASSHHPTVYLIRHGEKPATGNGLSAQGEKRAQCLVDVFNKTSKYKIDYIMAETPQSDGSQQRPYDTIKPLAKSLGLKVDTSCSVDNSKCVAKAVKKYTGSGNILICWEHGQLTDIVKALGDADAPTYPNDAFNLIWTDPYDYTNITSITSENCPGLDK